LVPCPLFLPHRGGSASNSGTVTPKEGDDEDYESLRERQKAAAAAAAAEEATERAAAEARDREEAEARERERNTPIPPELLTDKDLDRGVSISLQETGTDFLLIMPCECVGYMGGPANSVAHMNDAHSHALLNVRRLVFDGCESLNLPVLTSPLPPHHHLHNQA
jgi:hypothetical protein